MLPALKQGGISTHFPLVGYRTVRMIITEAIYGTASVPDSVLSALRVVLNSPNESARRGPEERAAGKHRQGQSRSSSPTASGDGTPSRAGEGGEDWQGRPLPLYHLLCAAIG